MERKVRASGREVRVRDEGRGRPLLLVHGFPLEHGMWREQIGPLSEVARVLAIDLPGFGGSEGSGADATTMEEYADACAATLDALDVREPIVLCGLSMGGYVAWQFWARHASRLAALVLCDTRAAADAPETARNRLVLADRVLTEGPGFVAEAMAERLVARATRERRPELVDELKRMMLAAPARSIAAALRGMAQRPDMTARLPDVELPVLVICGDADVISPASEMQAFAARMPRASYVEIPDAGHMAPLEQPVAVNAALRSFLTSY